MTFKVCVAAGRVKPLNWDMTLTWEPSISISSSSCSVVGKSHLHLYTLCLKAPAELLHLLPTHPHTGPWNAEAKLPCPLVTEVRDNDLLHGDQTEFFPVVSALLYNKCPQILVQMRDEGTLTCPSLKPPCRADCYLPLNQSTASNYVSCDLLN